MSTLHSLLKKGREENGFSTRQLSKMAGIDQALVSKFENGYRIPTRTQVEQLADLLRLDEKQLLVHWYKSKLLHHLDFNPYAIQAVTEILEEKGIKMASEDKKESKIAEILSEIENLKNKLENL